jgi:hypothetical protein
MHLLPSSQAMDNLAIAFKEWLASLVAR